MGYVTAAQWIYYGAIAVSTGVAVHSQRQAAGAQQVELDVAKRQEATAMRDREVQRKRRISAILGEQSARAAAGGTAMSGSVANISITDAKRAGEESQIDDMNTRASIRAMSRQSKTVGRLANYRSATSILGATASIAGDVAGSRPPPAGGGGTP
jgi:hypothetical protein